MFTFVYKVVNDIFNKSIFGMIFNSSKMYFIYKFMRKNYKALFLIGILTALFYGFFPKKSDDNDKDKMLVELLTFVLEKGHFSPVDIDDDFSKQAFKSYIESVDPTKRYLHESDYKEFLTYENSLDDVMKYKDLKFFNLTYDRLILRINESKDIYTKILSKDFNLKEEEFISVDYDNKPFSKDRNELEKNWTKQLKFALISTIADKEKLEDDNLQKNSSYKKKSFETLKKEAITSLKSNLETNHNFMTKEMSREDWFSIFLNSLVTQYDPHTYYFSPEDKEKFDTSMSGKFEGIGARLSKKNDAVEVAEIISGGPAWRGKQLEQGDLILKVAQGAKEPIDIGGMRLDDAIKLIKGAKGTEVRLTIKKIDGTVKTISITRDEVETEETFAKSSTVQKNGKLYGIINLPKFYINFENKANRDAFKDVAAEIEKLKSQKVEGIIMDLRDNGGGSLETVVKMSGLFIEQGPIVQVKSSGRRPEILPDTDPKVQWDGPLVIMVNKYSASASEILAAAMQDYKRAIVVGSKQTYGKGTVQNIFELNNFLKNSSFGDLGAIKTTTQKFYRINGGSTQLEGVKSDIVLPDRLSYIDTGEKDEKNALKWDKIEPAKYSPEGHNFDYVVLKSKKRIALSDQFKLIDENAKWLSDRKKDKKISLNIDAYKKELIEIEKETKKFKRIEDYSNGLVFNSLPDEESLIKKDEVLKEKRQRWHKDMNKDAQVEEAINVLSDIRSIGFGFLTPQENKKSKSYNKG